MRFLKSVLVFVLITCFVLFWGNSFVFAQEQQPQLPKPQTGDASLCNGAKNIANMTSSDYFKKYFGDLYLENKNNSSEAIDKNGNYKITLTYSYGGSSIPNYKDPTLTKSTFNQIKGGIFYYGRIGVSEMGKTGHLAIISANQGDPFADISLSFNVSAKPGETKQFGVAQTICFQLLKGDYTWGKERIIKTSKIKLDIASNKYLSITFNNPGEAPTINDGQSVDNPNAPDGGVSGYDACIKDPTMGCGTCCSKLKAGILPTIEYVECWITCTLDIGMANFIDQITKILEEAIKSATGLI